MSQQLFDVNSLKIAKPCSAKWAEMDGGARARYCGQCKKNVYNVAGMTQSEVAELIRANEGQVCMRLSRRKDGTIMTRDCPVGIAGVYKRLSVAVMVWFFVLFAGLATAKVRAQDQGAGREKLIDELRTKPIIGSVVDEIWPQCVIVGEIAPMPSPVVAPTGGSGSGTPTGSP